MRRDSPISLPESRQMAKKKKKKEPADDQDVLYLALEEKPGDKVTMLALADWLEEHGHESDATCIRWAAERGRVPYSYQPDTLKVTYEEWGTGWFWWAVDDPGYGSDWGHPAT